MPRLVSFRSLLRTTFLSVAPAAMTPTAAQAACDFAPVKNQTDTVLDKDKARAEKFRRDVASDADSIAVRKRILKATSANV
jgi:hypothetical protein